MSNGIERMVKRKMKLQIVSKWKKLARQPSNKTITESRKHTAEPTPNCIAGGLNASLSFYFYLLTKCSCAIINSARQCVDVCRGKKGAHGNMTWQERCKKPQASLDRQFSFHWEVDSPHWQPYDGPYYISASCWENWYRHSENIQAIFGLTYWRVKSATYRRKNTRLLIEYKFHWSCTGLLLGKCHSKASSDQSFIYCVF